MVTLVFAVARSLMVWQTVSVLKYRSHPRDTIDRSVHSGSCKKARD